MKNAYKFFALLCMGFTAVACVEENFENNQPKYDTTPGNEIVFTATAGIENGMPKTKTEYGDTGTQDGKNVIEINWVEGDKISIVSPQAAGAEVAHYEVSADSHTNGNYDGPHSASQLTRLGDAGLQWTAEDKYDFYAVYPTVRESSSASLTKEGVFTGTMPREQTYKRLDNATDENEKAGKIAVPNMDYAFMTASAKYDRTNLDEEGNSEPIDLQFESLVTALQFDITAGTINNLKDNVSGNMVSSYDIVSVSLISETKNIAGTFECGIADGYYKNMNASDLLANRVIMHFDEEPVKLMSGGGFLNVTFFLLPEEIPEGDLQLQVLFKLGSTQMSRTATINQKLTPGKKYIFNDVKLENFDKAIEAGSWFDTIDPNTLLCQLSIPVASNVFATSANGFQEKSLQQVKSFDQLWDLGVRGFELVTRRTVNMTREFSFSEWKYVTKHTVVDGASLSNAHFVCDEVAKEPSTDELPDQYPNDKEVNTFGEAFNILANKLAANKKEFLLIVCTYQAVSDGYNPDGYVSQLITFLEDFVKSQTNFSKDDFIQMSSSTTVGEAQGKICIIIRPGDDDRYETNSYTKDISLGNWTENITLIQDWGTAFDVWDRRYEGVPRESTFETLYVVEKAKKKSTANPTQIENWLWGVGSTTQPPYSNYNNNNVGSHNFNNGVTWPKKLESFNYEHAVTANNVNKAYVQEWARVAKDEVFTYTGINSSSRYLWVKWPDSFSEKKEAIDGLFKKSVDEIGETRNNLYINSLSGYFINKDIAPEGLLPFKQSFPRDNNGSQFSVSNQGKGGDHVGLAYELNKYVYGILSGESTMQDGTKLKPGPWGFVMMEHIGNSSHADDKSLKLVELIMMNNFKLDLTTTTPSGGQGGEGGGSTGTASVKDYDSVYLDGQNAISFE